MQLIDGRPVWSATDLVGFLACEHLTQLERAAVAGLVARPKRDDLELDVLARRGEEHERRYLADLVASGRTVTEIRLDRDALDRGADLLRAAGETADAMRAGADVIYQAALFDGERRGHADFLLKVPEASELGAWSYEVADTKLARRTKAGALLQICLYSEMVARLQGRVPARVHIVLGGIERQTDTFRLADYLAYYRGVLDRFRATLGAGAAAYPPSTYPEPVEHCEVCRWVLLCKRQWRDDDHLSLVAGITRRQRRALTAIGITTRTALGEWPLPVPRLDGAGRESLTRVREQARLQVEGERAGTILSEVLGPARLADGTLEPNRGLTSLPLPSGGDLFFDIEGDPFALDEGLDYLFGVIEPQKRDASGEPMFHTFWSRDDAGEFSAAGEKRAFEALIDLLMDRLERDPGMHVYHYAPYESTALKRLMGRYATREDEVDRLLRGGVFVDLHRAVRQGVRASVESYSIKKLEPLYGFEREVDLRDAGSSIVAFEAWLETGGRDADGPGDAGALDRIERYNRDDCVSNWRLRDWLEEQRTKLEATVGEPLPRPAPQEQAPTPELSERLARIAALAERLSADVPVDPLDRTNEQQARWLLAQLLSWHRREAKSFWWRYFHLMNDLTDEERFEEKEPLALLEYEGIAGEQQRSLIHAYRFPIQEHDVDEGTDVRDPATGKSPGTVVQVDKVHGVVHLKRGRTSTVPHPRSLVPYTFFDPGTMEDSLERIAQWVADHGIDGDGPYRAAGDLLLRRPPAGATAAGAPVIRPNESALAAAVRIASLDAPTVLAVQGPPGSGKTWTGARVALALVRAGKRVGVTAMSHKVIGNFLDKLGDAAVEAGVVVPIVQKPARDEEPTSRFAGPARETDDVRAALLDEGVKVAGGTAWLWAKPQMADTVDVLFVDEAAQLSLANVLAASPAARTLVLLGDPQQLDQPLQGVHPPGADRSSLAHLLDEHPTMPPDLGLFLERTWRLHPDICDFTSEAFYEGRLQPEPHLRFQSLDAPLDLAGTGVRFMPVEHEGNVNESPEEAEVIRELVDSLVTRGVTWTDAQGQIRPLELSDILIVAPYNAQVATIAQLLPDARVGTVDKFQGQEAAISIYSLTTSTPEEAPRGMEFLYSLNRLNVATSRARGLAIVVGSPDLIRVRCKTPRQMRLANALCRFVEMARVLPPSEIVPETAQLVLPLA